jgi:hypothetical protein
MRQGMMDHGWADGVRDARNQAGAQGIHSSCDNHCRRWHSNDVWITCNNQIIKTSDKYNLQMQN